MSDDRAIIGSLVKALGGTCRVCGCHGDECSLEAGERCCWMDNLRSLCSNPKCVMATHYRAKRQQKDRRHAAVKTTKRRVA